MRRQIGWEWLRIAVYGELALGGLTLLSLTM